MLLNSVFDRFVQESPVAVMVRGLLEHVLTPASVDALFEQHAENQYTRELLFSQVVDLMGQVVCGIYPSANAAYQKQRQRFTRVAHGRLRQAQRRRTPCVRRLDPSNGCGPDGGDP